MAHANRRRAFELFATLCFVLSGASALAYEVLWFKRFAHVWGSSSLAMASVVASFLAGLGLGARLLGARADRMARPLSAYAFCELFIAAWALCVPWLAEACQELAASATRSFGEQPFVLTSVRVASTFLVLAPACLAMGATLPLLVRWLAAGGRSVGRASAWMYAANAAGASAGAWLAGFHLLPALGLDGTNYVAAAASAAVGLVALVVDRRPDAPRAEAEPIGAPRAAAGATGAPRAEADSIVAPGASADSPVTTQAAAARATSDAIPEETEAAPAWAVNAAALATGFSSLALQMTWGRELALLVGPTTHAFSALVVVFVAGLGAGSLVFALAGRRLGHARLVFAAATFLVFTGTLAGRALEPSLARVAGSFVASRASPWFDSFLCLATSATLMFVATFAMGLTFPALIALGGSSAASAASGVGRVYGWNTLGSIVGALATGTLFVPALGGEGVTALALVGYALAALGLLAPRWRGRERELALVAAAVALFLLPWRRDDPRATNLGLYLYGSGVEQVLGGDRARVLSFAEGANANVLALEFDSDESTPGAPPRIKNLRVNGKVDASNWEDMPMQLGAAWFPRMLRPRARSVLVIGMGSGTTAGAMLAFDDTDVTVVEIEPATLEAARAFAPENRNPHGSPRFHAVVDDGRNFVQASRASYDLVISEPSNPWIAGISNLYTREFYGAARARLSPDGVLVQWLQTYGLSAARYALVARTALAVFPHVALVRINDYDTLFLCSAAPIVPPSADLDAAQAALDQLPDVKQELVTYFASADVRALLLSVLMLDERGLGVLCANVGGDTVNTDSNLALEFGAPRDLFGLESSGAQRPMDAIWTAFDPALTGRLIAHWGFSEPQLQALRGHKRAFVARKDQARAFALNELLLAWQPEDPAAMADQLAWAPPKDSVELTEAVAALLSRSPQEAARVAKGWLDQGQFARAKVVYRALHERMPDSPTVLAGLALCLANLAEPAEARALLAHAREIDPLDPLVHDLERVLANQ